MKIKSFFILLCAIGIVSCNKESIHQDWQVIDATSAVESKVDAIFDSLQVIQLEANTESFVGDVHKIVSCQDYYIFKNFKNTIYVFDHNGRFIANSNSARGKGKGEFGAMLGCCYNPFTKQIEILTPTSLKFYDIHFKFVKSVIIPTKSPSGEDQPGIYFDDIYDLSPTRHILLARGGRGNSGNLYIFDSEEEKIKETISFEDEIIEAISNQGECFCLCNNKVFGFLPYLTNRIYCLENNNLTPYLAFDFGDKTITKQHVQDMPNKTREEQSLRKKFIRNGPFLYPLTNAICGNKLFSYIRNGKDFNDWYFLMYDLESHTTSKFQFYVDNIEKFNIECIGSGNSLYCVCRDNEVASAFIKTFNKNERTTTTGFTSDSIPNENIVLLKYTIK